MFDLKIFDFSNLNNLLNESLIYPLNESTLILASEPFYLDNKKTLRIIVSNPNENKRLVFLMPCKNIMVNQGYSLSESKDIIESLKFFNEYLFESIKESADNSDRNNDNNLLPRVTTLEQKDTWKFLKFRYLENGQSGFKYAILIDASDRFSKQFLHGLVIAMRTSSKEINEHRGNPNGKGRIFKNVYLEDWSQEGFSKKSYACCFSEDIQQLPVENFSHDARKIGEITPKDWKKIREETKINCNGADINNIKITSAKKTSTSKKQRPVPLVDNTVPVIRKTFYDKQGRMFTNLVPEDEPNSSEMTIKDRNPSMYDKLKNFFTDN